MKKGARVKGKIEAYVRFNIENRLNVEASQVPAPEILGNRQGLFKL
jgi:hypothetical protein